MPNLEALANRATHLTMRDLKNFDFSLAIKFYVCVRIVKVRYLKLDYYVQDVCTPSRASIMTARYPIRYGLNHDVIYGL